MNEKEQQAVLLNYRIAYLADTMVNWCPQLGTVLANDEVKDGLSVRGGFPVVQKICGNGPCGFPPMHKDYWTAWINWNGQIP